VTPRPDVICVVAFGCILPDELLAIAPLGCVNVHGSTLPRWRGAAPIQRAILAGDERAGISIMRIVRGIDAGAYCRQAEVEIGDKGCAELMSELAEVGSRELAAALAQMADGSVAWVEQDPALVTHATKITKAEMRLDPSDTVRANARRVQASTDAAPARLELSGKGLRALMARRADDPLEEGDVTVDHGRVVLGVQTVPSSCYRLSPMASGGWRRAHGPPDCGDASSPGRGSSPWPILPQRAPPRSNWRPNAVAVTPALATCCEARLAWIPSTSGTVRWSLAS